jgi:hypothetical protein
MTKKLNESVTKKVVTGLNDPEIMERFLKIAQFHPKSKEPEFQAALKALSENPEILYDMAKGDNT